MSVIDARGRRVGAGGLAAWLTRVAPAAASGEVTVMLVSDRHMRRLNRRFRRVDAPTDVLSFPISTANRRMAPFSGGRRGKRGRTPFRGSEHTAPALLGDVVIATLTARRQARAAGHGYSTELRVLALHGLLHLLGYDHERDEGRMARVERRLRRRGGLREGLIGRRT